MMCVLRNLGSGDLEIERITWACYTLQFLDFNTRGLLSLVVGSSWWKRLVMSFRRILMSFLGLIIM